ncbi:secretory carrier membrane protein 3 [Rhinolophus ferrumequinum]|uniref:Secretory carrier-associated membrane protein n=1 Tax=Rhinolophus ferrumequinum TaxID=59479 RepID=A0A7J7SZ45_RHIFE|nr:secretory carrier membrane protein 3 [Rhinolophus ferrumequinum]
MEIPQEFQKTVSTMYYLWMCSTLALLLNFLACLASFCVETSNGSGFGLSILWVLLFTPCSFVCWYRPMYKAFRSDSSFNFFVFFFIFFAQDVLFVLQAIGIPGWGFSGAEVQPGCRCAHAPGGPAFHRHRCPGDRDAKADPFLVPPHRCQLSEGAARVCGWCLLKPCGANRSCQCGRRGCRKCLPGPLSPDWDALALPLEGADLAPSPADSGTW